MIKAVALLILALAVSTVAQPLTRYSFKREVTVQVRGESLVRRSTFTYRDGGKQLIETDVEQTGQITNLAHDYWRRFPIFPIYPAGEGQKPTKGFAVTWTNEGGIDSTKDRPWFADDAARSGLFFPVRATMIGRDFSVTARFYDYREFRTDVSIREVDEP